MTEQNSSNSEIASAGANGAEVDLTAVAVQDTGYVFDAHEAILVASVIDEGFADNAGYINAHGKIRIALAALCGSDGDNASKFADRAQVGNESQERVDEPTVASMPAVGARDIEEPVTHEVDRALMYELVVPFDGPVMCNLGHYDTGSAFVWPPRIEKVTESVVDLWEILAANVSAPPARARFNDLAMCRGRKRYLHGVAARDAYLEFASSLDVVDSDRAYALLRAWAIDRMFGRADREQECRVEIAKATAAAWDAGERAAGVLLPLLGALCRTHADAVDDAVPVDALLQRASKLYFGSDSVNYIGDLRRGRAATQEERNAISMWQVGALAEEARNSTGLIKVIRLKEAIDLARRLQVKSMQDDLTVELQGLPPEDVKLDAVSSTVRVSRIPLEHYFRKFTDDRDWRHGISLFASTTPPTGQYEDLVKYAEERRLRPYLSDLFSTVLLDEDRLPTWQPQTEDERREWIMARQAAFRAEITGTHLAEILDRIRIRYGLVPVDDITAHLAWGGRGNYELAAVVARGLHHYWNGDLEACVHVTVPRVESAIRLLLRELDVAIYRTQLGQRPGVYPALGSLLDALESLGFDDSWAYFMRWFLADHSGKNLRNQIAHGRVTKVSFADAALALRALMLVTLLAGPGIADDIEGDLEAGPVEVRTGASRDSADLAAKVKNPVAAPKPFPSQWLLMLDKTIGAGVSLSHDLLGAVRAARRR
ncbi:hypothetical protein V6K52_09215 [Knoellia sp. S7-12]|uniref:hypothetical protein n=1 Tax=Knoellia sp. S7-12 TaxID=3126698 RepID=UPI00336650D3